ncbi:hypothetical protein B0H16DRAFT_1547794 [Mycena metata]|uniref:Uncharacterized protein n=1 Tax=Mycena metata TaxID=1033252 RepID=A0AAD7IXX7_9AGAR|nr:hypothetical protein B0H16DRAFT_1547794 [Mycena metata]
MGSSRADFTSPTAKAIRSSAHRQCVLCLLSAPPKQVEGDPKHKFFRVEAAHLIAADNPRGESLMGFATELKLLGRGFKRGDPSNGVALCNMCHVSYFDSNHLVWSPHAQLLAWILAYVEENVNHEHWEAALKKDTRMTKYFGLYTIVGLKRVPSNHVGEGKIPVPASSPTILPHVPWVPCWDTTVLNDQDSVRWVTSNDLQYLHWRLSSHISLPAILVVLIDRCATLMDQRLEVQLVQQIHLVLATRRSDLWVRTRKLSSIPRGSTIPKETGLPTPASTPDGMNAIEGGFFVVESGQLDLSPGLGDIVGPALSSFNTSRDLRIDDGDIFLESTGGAGRLNFRSSPSDVARRVSGSFSDIQDLRPASESPTRRGRPSAKTPQSSLTHNDDPRPVGHQSIPTFWRLMEVLFISSVVVSCFCFWIGRYSMCMN